MRPLITKPHLFISYSRKNGEVADYLYRFLSAAGFTVYYDKEKTLVGERFAVQIVKELKRSDAVVAIVSFASAQSSLGTIGWRISPLHPQIAIKGLPVHRDKSCTSCKLTFVQSYPTPNWLFGMNRGSE